MLILRELIQRCHHQRVPHIAGAGCQQFLIHIESVMLYEKGHQHDQGPCVALPERVYLPDLREAGYQVADKLLSGELRPVLRQKFLECVLQIPGDILIIAVPYASASQQFFPLLNINDPVLSSPVINISKQKPMDLTQACRGEIREPTLIEQHHIGAGLFSLYQIQHLFIPDVQFVFQDRGIRI